MKLLRVEPKARHGDYRYATLVFESDGKEYRKSIMFGGVAERLRLNRRQEVMYSASRALLEARQDAAMDRGEDHKTVKASDPEQYELADQFAAMWPEIDAALR